MKSNEGGFTIVEILMAVMVLSVGILALVGSSALVTRMVGRGKTSTFAAQAASRRIEWLRNAAARTAPPCTHATFVSSAGAQAVIDLPGVTTERWTVAPSGTTRLVKVYVTYRVPRGTRTDTTSTLISCFLP